MEHPKPTLVLFPGSWGNKSERYTKWWFRHVINYFRHWNVVVMTYRGEDLDEYVTHCLKLLRNVPDGSYAMCYSAGAQYARGVAAERPDLFKRVVLVSAMERVGIRLRVLIRGLMAAFRPLARCLIGKPFMLDSLGQTKAILFGGTKEDATDALAQEILSKRMHPEPAKVVLQLALPGMRKRMPAFTCPVLAFVPDRDFFFPKEPSYPDEHVQKVHPSGDHTLICGSEMRTRNLLTRAETFLRAT